MNVCAMNGRACCTPFVVVAVSYHVHVAREINKNSSVFRTIRAVCLPAVVPFV